MTNRCDHCGINLAKVDPADVVEMAVVNVAAAVRAAEPTEPVVMRFCSRRCSDWWTQQKAARTCGSGD